MVFKKTNVLCTKCGFFCWGTEFQYMEGRGPITIEELIQCWRDDILSGKCKASIEDYDTDEYSKIHCLRGQWIYSETIVEARLYVSLDNIRQPRRCVYYIGYEPGYGPEEHKELKREAETRRTIFLSGIIGAVIGAGASTIGYLISH